MGRRATYGGARPARGRRVGGVLGARGMVWVVAVASLAAAGAWAQVGRSAWSLSGLVERGDELYPRFEMAYVDPAVHHWYEPRHLAESYVRPWYVSDRQAAMEVRQQYVSNALMGEPWYDRFGRRIGPGWLVYSWNHEQPVRSGSSIVDQVRAHGFDGLVIANDEAGGATCRLMVGDALEARLTPLTLFKPRFTGVRLDHATDRFASTVLASRPSHPGDGEASNVTHLLAGHVEAQVGGEARVGLTYANAHNSLADMELGVGNPLHGTLTTGQNRPVSQLWVRLRDDSPADLDGGATLYRYDIVLKDTSGVAYRGSELGLIPRVEGGRMENGALVADGSELVVLEYDLTSIEGLNSGALRAAEVELTIGNDYAVDVATDLQTSGERYDPEVVYLPAARAEGNVQDGTNGTVLRLDYGLPTANELLGVNWDVVNWRHLSCQGEVVLNRQVRQYPNPNVRKHHYAVTRRYAAYVQAAYNRGPVGALLELYSMDDEYTTRYWLTSSRGEIKYKSPVPEVFEFVEDDDDRDGLPEWVRPNQVSSEGVAFPGFDENRDFTHDLNQNGGPVLGDRNGNLAPDYDEPFLRFRAERPEFLIGPDMNHNGTVDRFENDLEPDYPYRRDHRGRNAYARLSAGPRGALLVGHQDARLISGDGQAKAGYVQVTWSKPLRRNGRLRVYAFGERVRDNIPDDLQEWVQPVDAVGRMRDRPDLLAGRDAWRATAYGDWDQRLGAGLRLFHRAKWDQWWQCRERAAVTDEERRMTSGFAGLVNRAEWPISVGLGTVEPRWKSELRRWRPYSSREPAGTGLRQTAMLLWTQPILAESTRVGYYPRYGRGIYDTQMQVGVEWTRFWVLEGAGDDGTAEGVTRSGVAQVANRVGYLGYNLVTRLGVLVSNGRSGGQRRTTSTAFITITAGLR